jgi:DNA replication and repair protein RecF
MFLDRMSLKKLRNIREANLTLHHKTNVIIGENAAGKTTLLEAVDILSRGRSFRTNKTENLVCHGNNSFYVGATLGPDKKKLEIEKSKNRTKISINGKEEKKQSRLAQELAIQSIHPNSHSLIEGAPSERRAFLDWGLFHVEHEFRKEWSSYIKILRQRNEALKSGGGDEKTWMEKLAVSGEIVSSLREKYVLGLEKSIIETQKYLMPESEIIFYYEKGWGKDKSFMESLTEKRSLDMDRGYTSSGPQNADIKIMLNGKEAQKICSRGQQKLIANIMLLSQAKDFFEQKKFPSIILVDDLSAELTLEIQERILERLFETKSQIFLTALNDSVLADILCEMDANVFHVEHGDITQ